MTRPLVSAVIVTYDYGRFVEEAIESALGQGLPPSDLEVIVVDDGSTDDTATRVRRFGDRIRYLRQDNGGEASALNLALAHSRGEIVALLEADDVWLPDKLRRVCQAFERAPEAGMVYHPYETWDTRAGILRADRDFLAISGGVPARLVDLLNYDVSGTSVLSFRRSALDALLPIPLEFRTSVDAYLVHLAIYVAPVVAVPERLTRYRKHGQNQSGDHGDRRRLADRWHYAAVNLRAVTAWLAGHGYDLGRPDVAPYLQRWQLWEEMCRFECQGAGRRELFAHLRAHQRLYGPLWDPGYRAFKAASTLAALALGYERFNAARHWFGRTARLVRARKRLLPRYARAGAGSAAADRGALW